MSTKINEDKYTNSSLNKKIFTFQNKLLDNHIGNTQSIVEANFQQISFTSLGMFGFILSHAGIKDTCLYVLDLSESGTGKSHNMSVQNELLLRDIYLLQAKKQLAFQSEDEIKRFINIHRGKITVPALYQCIISEPAQLVVIDELGMLLEKNDDLIMEIVKFYGSNKAYLPNLKTEIPIDKADLDLAFSFIGATNEAYFGGKKKLEHHLKGGLINRCLISYNTILKRPEEINSISSNITKLDETNEEILKLISFVRECTVEFLYSEESNGALLSFKREIQSMKIQQKEDGSSYEFFYSRVFQNTQIIVRILHCLDCFEQKIWFEEIPFRIVNKAISFMKRIVFLEIDKLIDYLSDGELLDKEEKQKLKIREFIASFEEANGKMPKIRDISLKTRLSKNKVLELMKDYFEVIPGTTIIRYCENK